MLKFCKSVENFDIFCAPMASEVGDKCVYRQRCKVVDRAISCPGQLSESIACRAVRSGECRRYTLGPTLLDLRFKRRLIILNNQHIPTGADTTLRHSRRKLPPSSAPNNYLPYSKINPFLRNIQSSGISFMLFYASIDFHLRDIFSSFVCWSANALSDTSSQ